MSTLVHDALVYDSDEEFVDVLAPFALEGLDRGEDVCVVSRPDNCDALRAALGGRAADVRFLDSTEWYRSPARTIAAYHSVVEQSRRDGAAGLRVVGEVEFGETELEHAEWARYESALNVAFQSSPAWIVCPYDARRLPSEIVDDAGRTHRHAIRRGLRSESPSFVEPAAFASSLPVPTPDHLVDELEVDGTLGPVRQLVARTGRMIGLGHERVAELCIVVTEIATNAVLHGERPIVLRTWADDDAVVFEVRDAGRAPVDPLAGFIPPDPRAARGRGLWIARQLADRVEVSADGSGTSVHVAAFRDA